MAVSWIFNVFEAVVSHGRARAGASITGDGKHPKPVLTTVRGVTVAYDDSQVKIVAVFDLELLT